jgi:hypothetical protein
MRTNPGRAQPDGSPRLPPPLLAEVRLVRLARSLEARHGRRVRVSLLLSVLRLEGGACPLSLDQVSCCT